MTKRLTPELEQQIIDTYAKLKNGRATARELGVGETSVRAVLSRTGVKKEKPKFGGGIYVRETLNFDLPKKGQVKRYLLTSAQNNTHVHPEFLNNLESFADNMNAEIKISTFAYNKHMFSQPGDLKGPKNHKEEWDDTGDKEKLYYDEKIMPYRLDAKVQLAPGLVLAGEQNILPTAVNPISGLDTYTGRNSGIIPHAKLAMRSVPAMRGEGTKFNYTTGAVTQRNYIEKKAGLKAEFHHSYGALLVEINTNGQWWVRQLSATDEGDFYDLDKHVEYGDVTTDHNLAAVNWGDVHVACVDPVVAKLSWEPGGILDIMHPEHQFMHDLLDMRARGHHDIKNCHRMYERYMAKEDNVEKEIYLTAKMLEVAHRDFCKTVVVASNHNSHFERWLREEDYKKDPVNAQFFLKAQLAKYKSISDGLEDFQIVEWALRNAGCPDDVMFLPEDDSYVICKKGSGSGIECGIHGHNGPNGARGTPNNISKLGRKVNMGHTHSPGIFDGVYVAGTSSRLRLDYNHGPSSWSHSHIFTYPNAKRAIITIWDGKWRA